MISNRGASVIAEDVKEAINDIRSSQKSRETEDYLNLVFTEPVGYLFTRFFIAIGFTPNMVSMLALIIGIVGGVLFYPKDFTLNLIGVLLEVLSIILDATDGQMARLTKQTSELGRFLDGCETVAAYSAMYIALGFRMMSEPIPFTDGILFGPWVWLLVLPCGGIFHASQCRMSDYYRNLHLYFLLGEEGSELSRSEELKERYAKLRENGSLWTRLYLVFYIPYTQDQEKQTPNLQVLLERIRQNGGEIPEEARRAFLPRSRRYMPIINMLTVNLRAYVLFALVLLGLHVWFFPFVILILEGFKIYMVYAYEKLAQELLQYFPQEKQR